MTNHSVFGGALPEESPDYVKRDADDQLFSALEDRKFCYVLNSRQTGKSSLSVQTRKRLREAGIYYFYYDMSKQGKSAKDTDEWYQDQINAIIRSALINYKIYLLDINENIELDKVSPKLKEWWESRSGSSLGKYEDFIEGHLLQNIKGNIVFIFDEIDSVMNLLFPTEDFFGFIRGCHEDRRDKKQYERLTFCLMGVASPNNLIADKDRTPFNIGTAINLRPFPTDLTDRNSRDTMKPLLNNTWMDINLLQQILNQTGGQPFLTHKLWCLVVEERKADRFTTIEEFVNSKIIDRWKEQDLPSHLTTIQDRFKESQRTFLLLDLYQKILQSENMLLKVDDDREQLELELKLSGLVLQENGFLKPYNRIYTRIFNLNWVETEREKLRLYIEEFENWKKADPRQKERYLLYGDKGEQVQQWRENFQEPLYETEARFLDQSEEFWKRVQRLFPNLLDNKKIIEKIIQSTNHWTGGFKLFNNIMFEKAAETDNLVGLQQDKVQGWLENLVLRNLNFFEKYDQFQKDRDQFSNQEDASIDSFALISTFEQIAQKEPVPFDENNPQHRKLKAMCFIILDQDNKLRILNKIYEKLLNQDWIKEVMAKLRPYTKAFQDWKKSDRQEQFHLLKNNNLKLALEWLGKKPTPTLEEREIEFVMTSLVAEVWAKASPSVQSEAISLIIDFRPSLQGKNNYSDFLLREILQWTKSQTPALEKFLGWVNESEIPIENNRKWLESLIGSHIKNWSCQELFDFSLALHSSQKEKDREVFISFDEYLGIKKPQKVIPKETLKKYEKILDKDQESNNNDFQKLVLTFLQRKIARISLMSTQQPEQEELDVLMDEIVIGSKGHLKSILIFDLESGLPLYHNKQLKSDDPDLYYALFAEEGSEVPVGEAIEGFESLSDIQEALDSFGDVTKFGNLIYSIFKLKEGTMMVYFFKLTRSFAICFIAPDKVNLGLVVTRSAKIKEIQKKLEDLGF